MALLDIALEKIIERDLLRLIDGGAPESLYIDYKRQTRAPYVIGRKMPRQASSRAASWHA